MTAVFARIPLLILLLLAPRAAAGQDIAGATARPLAIGVSGFVYIERSEPGLSGVTFGGALVFAVRLHEHLSVIVEGGRAKFYADDQPGHRDFFFGGLVGVHPSASDGGLVLVAGPALIHSERHKFFGDLSTNRLGMTIGADWVWLIGERVAVAASWRTDLASGMTSHRPGASLRFRF